MWRLLFILIIAFTLKLPAVIAQEVQAVEQKAEMVICASCKQENLASNKFCTQCRMKIEREEKLTVKKEALNPQEELQVLAD
jgi:hypothetical protein